MIISIINHTNGKLSDEEVQHALRAINCQVQQDFEPYWSLGAMLRLEGKAGAKPKQQQPSDMRGDAVIYLWDNVNVANALGYHDRNNRGIPFGFVFTELSKSLGESWTVTLSHEALELIADPEVNLLVAGLRAVVWVLGVFCWCVVCVAVRAGGFGVGGIEVFLFVLLLFLVGCVVFGGRNDFLGRIHDGKTLRSFGVNPGGYIGFFNPQTGEHETYSRKGDTQAEQRMQIKFKAKGARRAIRYRRFGVKTATAKKTAA